MVWRTACTKDTDQVRFVVRVERQAWARQWQEEHHPTKDLKAGWAWRLAEEGEDLQLTNVVLMHRTCIFE